METWYVTLVFYSIIKRAFAVISQWWRRRKGEGTGGEGELLRHKKGNLGDFFISTISFKGHWNGRLAFQFEKFLQILLESEVEADMVAAKLS